MRFVSAPAPVDMTSGAGAATLLAGGVFRFEDGEAVDVDVIDGRWR